MNILVTGATGFLGRHLTSRLLEDGKSQIDIINTKTCDLLDSKNLLAFTKKKYDVIYHLAAWTRAGEFCLDHAGEQWIKNQLINTNLLWFWKEYQPGATLVAMGTSCAYPDGEQNLVESAYMTGEPSRDLYTYAMTKRMLLQGLKALNEQFGMKFQYFVPSTLYGPDFEENDNHFIFDLIKKITSAKRTGEPPILWGNGFQIRELIFVEDAVELILRYSMSPKNGIINLASGLGATIRDYAQKISLLVGYDSDSIIYDPDARYVGTMRRVLDVTQLKTDEPDFDWTPLDNGLRSTIDYYYKSYGSN